ncbi:hypothetical protein C8R43DRAFT_239059 [Mycena crocata]|nr:hypothetical protein C8R43DRAFT_239059 [Mycena crocata]
MSSYSSSSASERPTLPPLHTLNLLPKSFNQQGRGRSTYDSYESPSCPRLNVPQRSWPYDRRVSMTSSTSRTPSPTPSDASSSASSSPTSPSKSKLTLIPSSFEDAEAIIVIPPPGAPQIPGMSSVRGVHSKPGQGLLLTGPALELLRHPQRQIAKGTRLHPYRFAGDASRRASRRSSMSSSLSSA